MREWERPCSFRVVTERIVPVGEGAIPPCLPLNSQGSWSSGGRIPRLKCFGDGFPWGFRRVGGLKGVNFDEIWVLREKSPWIFFYRCMMDVGEGMV